MFWDLFFPGKTYDAPKTKTIIDTVKINNGAIEEICSKVITYNPCPDFAFCNKYERGACDGCYSKKEVK